jgi:hypothetical protein
MMQGTAGDVLAGFNSATDNDVMSAQYEMHDMDSSRDAMAGATFYNKTHGELQRRWERPAAAVGKGLGAFAMNMLSEASV